MHICQKHNIMEAEGRLIEIFDANQVTDTFRKREFVVEMGGNPNYPETVLFQLVQDKCDILDNFKVNDEIVVSFDLRGRKWKSPKGEIKYFNTLQAWKLNKKSNAAAGGPPDFPEAPFDNEPPMDDDLPF